MDIQAIIFDCDGVLVDTEYLKFLAWRDALLSKNIDFTFEEYMPLAGYSSQDILRMVRQLKNVDIAEEVIELRKTAYRLLQRQKVPIFSQMVAFASQLSREKERLGLKLGLASSAPRQEIMHNLKRIDLEKAFDLILSGSDDLGQYTDEEGTNKPKPYIYMEMAKKLRVTPSQCLVFEDTAVGIQAANAAGMIAIAVPNSLTSGQDFSKAARVIREKWSPEEILKSDG